MTACCAVTSLSGVPQPCGGFCFSRFGVIRTSDMVLRFLLLLLGKVSPSHIKPPGALLFACEGSLDALYIYHFCGIPAVICA
jgi:hypothetical protein